MSGCKLHLNRYRDDSSSDPLDLPPDITNHIYTFVPEIALCLEPERQADIVHSLTGYRPPDSESPRCLKALCEGDYDILTGYPELYHHFDTTLSSDEREIWITALLSRPTIPALNELLRLEVISLEELRKFRGKYLMSRTFVKSVCSRGGIDIINELDRIGFSTIRPEYGHTVGIWEAYHELLARGAGATSDEVATELVRQALLPVNIILLIEGLNGVPLVVLKFIELYPDRMNALMNEAIHYLKYDIIRYLYEKRGIQVKTYRPEFPTDLMRAAIASGAIGARYSSSWTEAILSVHKLMNHEQIEMLLRGCDALRDWPFDSSRSGSAYPGFTEETVLDIIIRESPLLNWISPKLIKDTFKHGIRKITTRDALYALTDEPGRLNVRVRATLIKLLRYREQCSNMPDRLIDSSPAAIGTGRPNVDEAHTTMFRPSSSNLGTWEVMRGRFLTAHRTGRG